MGEVISIVRGGPKPEDPNKPPTVELVRDEATGLYSIICDCVEVYARLDPIGRRAALTAADDGGEEKR